MNCEEIIVVIKALVSHDFVLIISIGLIAFVFILIKFALPSYLRQKGENLASKEDLAQLTDTVEKVKCLYASLIEELKTKNQLRVAALSERLRAHQEAYQLWREINAHLETEEINKVILKCDEWWGKNCLYLEPEAREAFIKAFVGAKDLKLYKTCQDAPELFSKVCKEINDAGAAIERCVALPVLNELAIRKKV